MTRDLVQPLRYVKGFFEGRFAHDKRDCFGGPMNGQQRRIEALRAICHAVRFARAVETGSYRGDSTGFIAELTGAPVTTIEAHPTNWAFCFSRHFGNRRISVRHGDSRAVLKRLLPPNGAGETGAWFFYLDAHWDEDLPLREEVEIIQDSGVPAVILVDDFEVPGDEGYRYDNYGEGRRLSLAYLNGLIGKDALRAFFPTARSAEETGAVRGWIVLVTADLAASISQLDEVVEWATEESA